MRIPKRLKPFADSDECIARYTLVKRVARRNRPAKKVTLVFFGVYDRKLGYWRSRCGPDHRKAWTRCIGLRPRYKTREQAFEAYLELLRFRQAQYALSIC